MFFKSTANTRAEEIRKFIPVSVSTSFETLSPLIGAAETKFIQPLLGQALMDQVSAYYQNPESVIEGITEENKTQFDSLIELIQRALINLTYYTGFEFLSVSINDSGFHRQESETEKSLFRYQEEAIKNQFKDAGFNGLDAMLEYLEAHGETFPLFAQSANYTVQKSSIIATTKEFDQLIDINNSRLVFLKLRRCIEEVEDFSIKAALGLELYALLKAELVKSTLDERFVTLLPHVRKPLAHLAMARAFRMLGIHVRDRGVFQFSQEATMKNSSVESPVSGDDLHIVIKGEESTGEYYLATLREFLVEQAATYPEVNRTTHSPFVRQNNDKTTFWT